VKKPSIAIVGAGRFGTALAFSLKQAGYKITEIIFRSQAASRRNAMLLARKLGARAQKLKAAQPLADITWLCVPDSEIENVAFQMSNRTWQGKIAFHSGGALDSGVLGRLQDREARVASVHPLMTFLRESIPDLAGVSFAIEGDRSATKAAARIVRDLHGIPARIRKSDKAAYHAFATMICPFLIALLANAEEVAALAGISSKQARQRMAPIIQQTLDNYIRLGRAKAFTGPIVRGDLETVRLHLAVLERSFTIRNVYLSLAQSALRHLPARNRTGLQRLLEEQGNRS